MNTPAAMASATTPATTATAVACDLRAGGGAMGAPAAPLPSGARTSVGSPSGARSSVASASAPFAPTGGSGVPAVRGPAAARRAVANSAAVWKRSSGRFASALRTTASTASGSCTLSVEGGSGSSFSTFCAVVVADPANGRSPVRNW